jgi:hypothetical protein
MNKILFKNIFQVARLSLIKTPVTFFVLLVLMLFANEASSQGFWTQVTNLPPDTSGGGILLLSDGTIMAKTETGGTGMGSIGTVWNKLTPDNQGSYINGTWSVLPPMANSRLYFSTQVLKDGRVYVAGGEYGTGKSLAEMYDPLSNSWTNLPTPGGVISDANSEILPDGRVLQAMVNGSLKTTKIYNPATNTYTAGPTCIGIHNESVWVKLQDNSILFVDRLSTASERYIPSSNSWVADATVPVNLYDPFGDETGGALLLPDGRTFFLGSIGNTAYYTPSGNSSPGSWLAGPMIPNFNGATDAMMAMMPNGKILCAVSPTPTSANHFHSPTYFYEFDYTTNTFTQINAPYGGLSINAPAFIFNMINLPTGQILLSEQDSKKYWVYTPGGTPLAAGKPTINTVLQSGCTNFTITGTLFNGISEGSAYGDDWQNATNYPIVQLTNGANVYYARTFNWNRTAVQTGSLADTTEFTLPAGLPHVTYSLVVIANGIPSNPIQFTPFPILNSSNTPPAVCSNSTFSYVPTSLVSGSAFSWTRAAVSGITNTAVIVFQPGNINEVLNNSTNGPLNVMYTFSINAPSGCSSLDSIMVTVNVLPTISVSGNSVICRGDSSVLTASGANSYIWNTLASGSVISVNPLANTIYTVTGTDGNGCANTQQYTLTVNPVPAIFISGNANICIGDSVKLTANGSTTYSWSTGVTTNTLFVGPSVNTTYSVSSTNGFGCTGVASIPISIYACVGVKENFGNKNNIILYPNPAQDLVNVQFYATSKGNYSIQLHDALGRKVLNKNIELEIGKNSSSIELTGVAKGIYVLSVANDGEEFRTKLIIK